MDTSFWKSLSNDIKIEYTSKQFYKKYLYRLEIYAPGCKSIRSDDIGASIARRKSFARDYNYGGSWWDKRLKEHLKAADLGFLHVLKDIFHEYPDVKIRTEEPKVTIYADCEIMLQSVAESISPDHRHNIITITGPESSIKENILKSNAVLVKRQPEFKYRVYFKEKRFDILSRTQIHNYLVGLGDLIKMTSNTQEQLTRAGDWMWGCYFYTNDPGVANLIRLINPDIVREVCELVYIQE
jgi:hypothetical protein